MSSARWARGCVLLMTGLFGCEGNETNLDGGATVTPDGAIADAARGAAADAARVPGDAAMVTPSAMVTVGPNGTLTYSPSTVTVKAGQMVRWTWVSGRHTVTSGQPGVPDGKFCSLPAGATPSAQACAGIGYAMGAPFTYDFTFTASGTYPYYCTVHGAAMTGTVTVTSAP